MSLTEFLTIPFGWISGIFSRPKSLQSSEGDTIDPAGYSPRPDFDKLPLKQGDPKGSAWGLWGDTDERGTLNLITTDVVRAALAESVEGKVVNLKYFFV